MSRSPQEPCVPSYPVSRRWHRYRVSGPALVESLGCPHSNRPVVAGSIRDVGAGGIYVVSQEPMVAGERVRAHVDLGRLSRSFTSLGSVVRTEEYGFAIQFDHAVAALVDLPPATC